MNTIRSAFTYASVGAREANRIIGGYADAAVHALMGASVFGVVTLLPVVVWLDVATW